MSAAGHPKNGTAWRASRFDSRAGEARLLFGRMYEDCAIEERLFARGGRVFCIASAGCTALALALRGDEVTAVDINGAQVEYVQARAAGAAITVGDADRFMARGRRLMSWAGVSRGVLQEFLMLDDPVEQRRVWDERISGWRLRALIRLVTSRIALRGVYGRIFVDSVPRDFATRLLERFERGWSRHANRENLYAWRIWLGGEPPSRPECVCSPVTMTTAHADAASYLEQCEPGSFNGFSLSNIFDGASRDYHARVMAAVRRAAAPGAVCIVRTFSEPDGEDDAEMAAEDRTMLWGGIGVMRY